MAKRKRCQPEITRPLVHVQEKQFKEVLHKRSPVMRQNADRRWGASTANL